MKFNYKKKTVVITGGSSGIGKAMTKLFSESGATVYVLDMNEDTGRSLVEEVKSENGHLVFCKCDVSDQKNVQKIIQDITIENGVDILINNAGIGFVGNVENTSEEDFDRLYSVNVKGVYNCIKAVVPIMKTQQAGVIINMASIASTVGISDRFAYSMSKGAVLTMTYSVAKDYLDYNIRCNSISPARVHTAFVDGFIAKNYPGREKEMFENLSKTQPIGRMGKPEEIAALALYLCSNEAAFITGTDFPIDGGFIKLNG